MEMAFRKLENPLFLGIQTLQHVSFFLTYWLEVKRVLVIISQGNFGKLAWTGRERDKTKKHWKKTKKTVS